MSDTEDWEDDLPPQEPLMQQQREPIVCPYCGMSTWYQGRCALPGCEGHNVLNDGFGDG